MRTMYRFEANHEKWRVLSQHHYNTLRQKNIVFSLKERCSLLLLNTFPFTKVVHEDHPNLVTENLRVTTYEYYLHVYLNSRPPYCKYIVKIIYEIELNQEKFELKYKKDSLKDCIFKKNTDSGKIKLLMTDKNLLVVNTLLLCMGCHPHTRVNLAQCMIREETQEPMWLQTIYKIFFQHNKEASNTKRENGRIRRRVCPSHACFLYNKCPIKQL